MSAAEKIKLIRLLEERNKRLERRLMQTHWESLYGWQREFVTATANHTSCCLMAANRVGKTRTGLLIDAYHLTGEYPDDWEGHRFNNPPLVWLLGVTGEKTRDLLQTPLFGRIENGSFTGGLIPDDKIMDYRSMSGTSGAVREVRVKHVNGVSIIQFWSYSQGQAVLMGDSLDWYHIDEEPKDQTIFPQVLTRTATGDRGKGGRGILTFTPENGRTDTVIQFIGNSIPSQFFMQKGWDDAPHLAEDTKESLLAQYPEHQRDMRTKGEPMLGHGRIYDISDDFILCDPFDIPKHWFQICGMDFGYDHPQAFVKLAIDRDNDIVYLTNSWKQSKVSANDAWGATRSWTEKVPVAWPHDGLMHEKGRDVNLQQKDHYINAGFKMLYMQASWPKGGNSVETGITDIINRARKGTFRVFRGNNDFMAEWRQYHRDDRGRIVKTYDDMLDAARYAYMMQRFAKRVQDVVQSNITPMPPSCSAWR